MDLYNIESAMSCIARCRTYLQIKQSHFLWECIGVPFSFHHYVAENARLDLLDECQKLSAQFKIVLDDFEQEISDSYDTGETSPCRAYEAFHQMRNRMLKLDNLLSAKYFNIAKIDFKEA